MRTKAVLFCRVSSKEQEITGFSLPAQEKFLRDYAEKNQFEVFKVFAVSESASGKRQRKVFNEMIVFVRKNNIPVIIAESTDRVTRNFADVPTIDKWVLEHESHQIHLAKEGCILHKEAKSHEWFMWRVKVATAEYYIRLLSENVRKGQKEKIAQGGFPTKAPPGYKTVGEKGHKAHIVDENKAPLVKKMFEYYATGNYSLKALTKKMQAEKLTNYQGHPFVKSRIHQLLNDPFFIGKLRWNKVVTDGKHEPLIDSELFDKVQRMLKSKTTPKYRKHFHIFQKVFICAECKGTITWETHKNTFYGHCNHYRACNQKIWTTDKEVEKQLVNAFGTLQINNPRIIEWVRKALKENHKEEIAYNTTVLDELNKSLHTIQKRMDNLYTDKLDEIITKDVYGKKLKEFSEQQEEITKALQKHNRANTKYYELGANLYELSIRAKGVFTEIKNNEDKRRLITLVFKQLSLNEGKLLYTFTAPFRLLSELAIASNSTKIKKNQRIVAEIFDKKKKIDFAIQTHDLGVRRPNVLRD